MSYRVSDYIAMIKRGNKILQNCADRLDDSIADRLNDSVTDFKNIAEIEMQISDLIRVAKQLQTTVTELNNFDRHTRTVKGFDYNGINADDIIDDFVGESKKRIKKENNGMNYWSLIDYFDVWGNEEDGWEVNNQSVEFDDLYLSDDITDREIFEYLKSIGYLNRNSKFDDFVFEGDLDFIEIFSADTYEPLGRLERNY